MAVLLLILSLFNGRLLAVNYGDVYEVGRTYWFFQQNSNVGKMIARDELGGTHFVWTRTTDGDGAERHVYYSFCDDEGDGDLDEQLEENITRVNEADRAGYVSMDLYLDDDNVLATCFYHAASSAVMAFDFDRGFGAFSQVMFQLEDRRSIPIVVKGTIDSNQRAHIVAVSNPMGGPLSFGLTLWHAEADDRFEWNVSNAIDIENTTGLSHRIQAAGNSGRVSLAWHHNLVGVPAPEEWENSAPHTMNNDLYLIESPDGEEWDLDHPFNITRTIPPDNDREGLLVYGDTLRPFNDVDLIYIDEVVHAVFSTRGFLPDPNGQGNPPVIDWTIEESFIWHWDSESDTLTLVADGWYENEGAISFLNSNVDRPSLGINKEGTLFCIFRQVSDDDVDEDERCNGEVMLSLSEDDGITWSEAVNLTGTVYDEDRQNDYIDENHPSIAERVDDFLHVYYLLGLADTGDDAEESIMVYQRIPVDELPDVADLELPGEGFKYHNTPAQAAGEELAGSSPEDCSIENIYPNPFNALVKIEYRLPEKDHVRLSIYDLTGREMLLLVDDVQEAGLHEARINSATLPTGIYIAKLISGERSSSAKLICVK